jgi:uncharacterized membrane protein YvlD (DUF360 family)
MNLLVYTLVSAVALVSLTVFLTKKYNDKLPKNKVTDVLISISNNYVESLVVILTLFVASLYSGQSILNGMFQRLLRGLSNMVSTSCGNPNRVIFMRTLPRELM